ncbi:ubiquitin-conjugating enzyme [Nitzschia inconspicua]|uniref:Ubiquitin-conjugating enzyme n=1 Tax=Nitzschia inconspicua TaxID=303405 RepID=A0A9K3KMD0_9STRA|nr:ubiquitin-conjugating enzyme [Nitzschia inconspicua]
MRSCSLGTLLTVQLWIAIFVSTSSSSLSWKIHDKPSLTRSLSSTSSRARRLFPPSFHKRYAVTTLNGAVELLGLRGGEISLPEEEDDHGESSTLLSTVRSAIRGLLKFGDEALPPLSGILRSCFHVMEKLTGIKLLPSKIKETKASRKGSKKSKKSRKATSTHDDESNSATKKRSAVSKKASAATKKHVSGTLKSSNPNYRIQKELKKFIKEPPPNLSVQVGSNIRVWVVTMVGANNTIYEGEVFKLRISFPKDYPTVPPSVYFLKGYIPKHEHVYTNGDICLSLLGKDWRPTMTAQSVANSILSILSSAQHKSLPMDNAAHANAKPGEYQKDWVYHDDRC